MSRRILNSFLFCIVGTGCTTIVVVGAPADGGVSPSDDASILSPDTGPVIRGTPRTDEFEIAEPALVAATGERPAIAFDGERYLVVWTDTYTDEVRATRVSRDGEVLDQPSITLPGGQPGGEPRVAAIPGQFLVVYPAPIERREIAGSGVLMTRVRSEDGTILDPEPFSLVGSPGFDQPDVASNGTHYLVVTRVGETKLFYRYIDATGSIRNGRVVDEGHQVFDPSIASNGTDFVITWQRGGLSEDLHSEVRCMRVPPSESAELPTPIGLATHSGMRYAYPRVRYLNNTYLVAWAEYPRILQGIRLDANTLDRMDIEPLILSEWTVDFQLITTHDAWFALGVTPDASHFQAIRLEPTSTMPEVRTLSIGIGLRDVNVAFGSDRLLLAWCQDNQIEIGLLDPTQTIPEMLGSVAFQSGRQVEPSIAANHAKYLVTWAERQGIRGVRIDGDTGRSLDENPLWIVDSMSYGSALSSDGENFLLVWHKYIGGARSEIHATPVLADGTVLSPILLAPSADSNQPVVVAGNEHVYLIVFWTGSSESELRAVRLASGTWNVLDSTPITVPFTTTRISSTVQVASDGEDFVILGSLCRGSGDSCEPDVEAVWMSGTSGVAESRGVISEGGSPVIANLGDHYFAIWLRDFEETRTDIHGTFLDHSGRRLVEDDIPLVTDPGDDRYPFVVSDGSDLMIGWVATLARRWMSPLDSVPYSALRVRFYDPSEQATFDTLTLGESAYHGWSAAASAARGSALTVYAREGRIRGRFLRFPVSEPL